MAEGLRRCRRGVPPKVVDPRIVPGVRWSIKPDLVNRELTACVYLHVPCPALILRHPALSLHRPALCALLRIELLLKLDLLMVCPAIGFHGTLILLGDADPALHLSVLVDLLGGN